MEVIDSDDYGASGIEAFFFPGGEPYCKINRKFEDGTLLFLKLRTWNDVGLAASVLDVLWKTKLKVFIPYFPGARQDHPVKGTPDTPNLMSNMLCLSGNFYYDFYTFDLHSDLYKDYFAKIFMPSDLPIHVMEDVVGIISPDEGSRERSANFRDRFYPKAPIVECSKHRDPNSGALSGYHMPTLESPGRYIIVDDICDGGGTFNLLAGEFKKQAEQFKWSKLDHRSKYFKLELFVSHGIFSKGLGNLDPIIANIETTNGFFDGRKSWSQLNRSFHSYDLRTLFPLIEAD